MKSGIVRIIDVSYASNRFVVAATLVAGAIGLVASLGDGLGNAIGRGVLAGGAAFLAWAIAREVDPDHTLTSYLAAPIGLALWFVDPPGLLVTGAVLMAVRVLAGTTGYLGTRIDLVFLIVLAALAGWRSGGVIAGIAIGLAVILGCVVSGSTRAWRYWGGLLAVIAAGVAALVSPTAFAFVSITPTAGVVAAAAVAAAALTPVGPLVSTGDLTGEPLAPSRVRAARLLAAALVAGYLAFGGEAGITLVGPVAASLMPLPLAPMLARREGS